MNTPPETIIAFYPDLKSAQDTMDDLEQHGLPSSTIRLRNHTGDEPGLPRLEQTDWPDLFWSLSVVLKKHAPDQVLELLRMRDPLAVVRKLADNQGRDEVDQGAIAWRHYVFAPPDVLPGFPETGGNAGTTGTVSTGMFAEGSHIERTPPLPGFAAQPVKPDPDKPTA